MKPITIIQGAQAGSEGKGMVAGALAAQRNYSYAVRTGAINAGHTVYYKGKPYAMQQIPVAWVNPETILVIGPGAYVHIPTLLKEMDWIKAATGHSIEDRLYIDRRAAIHLDAYSGESQEANRHHLIGATGKGCAEAIIHKIKDRGVEPILLRDYTKRDPLLGDEPWQWADVPDMLTRAYYRGASIMLEGTQGELLDFHLGPWPYVTSRQTTPAAWVAEAGLSPSLEYEIVLVARTYPIRVAGNSGPMLGEISWPWLAREIRSRLYFMTKTDDHPLWVSEPALDAYEHEVRKIGERSGVDLLYCHTWGPERREAYRGLLSEYAKWAIEGLSDGHRLQILKLFEMTTVTKKLRRVATFDDVQIRTTCDILRPAMMVLTFLNYQYPELHGCTRLSSVARDWAAELNPRIRAVTTGPEPEHFIWL